MQGAVKGSFFVFSSGVHGIASCGGYSTIVDEFCIAEVRGADPGRFAEALDLPYREARGRGFVLFQPWWPGRQRSQELFLMEFPDCRRIDGELWVEGEPNAVTPSRVLQVRRAMGASRSGLWLCGIAPDVGQVAEDLTRRGSPVGSPVGLAIEVAEHIDVAIAFDEGGVTSVMLRRKSAASRQWQPLLDSLTRLGIKGPDENRQR
jgi:hypothetical protein